MLQDEDYAASLALHSNNEQAALRNLAAGLAAQFASQPDRVTLPSGLSVSWSQRLAQWNRIAAQSPTPTSGRGARIGHIAAGTKNKMR
jgi:hypothetical protein